MPTSRLSVAGDPALALSNDEGGMELRAEDVVEHAGADLDGWSGRFALIRALFPDADVSDTTVRIRVPVMS